MSILEQDITEEEKASGFDAGEQGDETFMLEQLDEYPGVMPELDYMEEPVIPPVEGESSLEDSFEETPNEEDDETQNEIEEDVSEDDIPDYEEIPEYEDEDDEAVDSSEDIDEGSDDISIQDDDLKQLVQSELDRSKKLKENRESSDSETYGYGDDDIEPVPEFFEEVDESAPKIGISEIDLDKPSRINVKKIAPFVPADSRPEVEVEEEKKNKKTPFFSTKRVLAFSGMVAILFISLIVIFYEDIVTKNKFDLSILDSPEQDSTELAIETSEQKAPKDTVVRKPINLGLLKETSLDEDGDKSDSLNVEMFVPEEIQTDDSDEKPNFSDNEYVALDKSTKQEKSRSKKKTQKKTKTKAKKQITKNDKNLTPDLKKGPSKKGTFAVQVISTPSYDDANYWLDKLKARGIYNGNISEKLVRDKKWYRVRFGNFETYQDASEALKKAGFEGSWVDRIK